MVNSAIFKGLGEVPNHPFLLNRLGATVAFMQQKFYDLGMPLSHKYNKMMST